MSGLFVILEHKTPDGPHWDLMLEHQDKLLTWRIEIPQSAKITQTTIAQQIQDHPIRFLDYEGPVQKNTASVARIDRGNCTILEKSEQNIRFVCEGKILNGPCRLTRNAGDQWTLTPLCEGQAGPARCEP